MAVLGWMVFGLIVGAIAKLVMPGRDPGGFIVTMLLGIVGGVIGGWIGQALRIYNPGEPVGYVMATLGAIVLLTIYRMTTRHRPLTH
ncbi:MAG: GlsB/YeaQ/YmgE family stress response membrane protein [Acidobacteria bacterium]|nr:GlsB/YeaQ/YmgE family stress response membrane protein [Acidobacteriota bacterium]